MSNPPYVISLTREQIRKEAERLLPTKRRLSQVYIRITAWDEWESFNSTPSFIIYLTSWQFLAIYVWIKHSMEEHNTSPGSGGTPQKPPKRKKLARLAPPAQVPEVMDIREISNYLGIGKSKIYALIRSKKIPASRIGRQYRFHKALVDRWLQEKTISGESSGFPLFPDKP